MISSDTYYELLEREAMSRGLSKEKLCRHAGVDLTTFQPCVRKRKRDRGRLDLPSLPIMACIDAALGLGPLGLLVMAEREKE